MENKNTDNSHIAQNPQHHDGENVSHQQKGSSERHREHQQKTQDSLKDRRPIEIENENQQDEPTDRRKAS